MVQIIQRAPETADYLFEALGKGAEAAYGHYQQEHAKKEAAKEMQMENAVIKKLTGHDIGDIKDPKIREKYFSMALQAENQKSLQEQKLQGKRELQKEKQDQIAALFGGNRAQGQQSNSFSDKLMGQKSQGDGMLSGSQGRQMQGSQQRPQMDVQQQGGLDIENMSPEDLLKATMIDPNIGRSLQHSNDVSLREKNNLKNFEHQKYKDERDYNTQFSKESRKEVEGIRTSQPKSESALNFARAAIESGEVGAFSLNNLGERLGIPELQTAKGAQLALAAKENLLGTLGKVSGKGQNMYMEKRISSMFAQVGKSKEANLTAQEMLEAEAALNKAYLSEYDRIAEQDEKLYGFERKDIAKRAQDAVKPLQKEIVKRSSYRVKQLEEQEKGLQDMKKKVGKNVDKGEPLTLAMAKLYKEKFGDKALDVAKKNGYYIPTLEEFQAFQQTPQEYRDELVE